MNIKMVYIPRSLTSGKVVVPAIVDAVAKSIFRFLVGEEVTCRSLELKDTTLGVSLLDSGLLLDRPRFLDYNLGDHKVDIGTVRDIVMTSYFASKRDPQRRRTWKRDSYEIMRKWHLSIKRLNLSGVVFHDHLSTEFISRFSDDQLQFVHITLGQRSTNDDRYSHYLRYLEESPHVRYAILTDISDVEIKLNVFSRMQELDTSTGVRHIYVGQDIVSNKAVGSRGWMRNVMSKCFGSSGGRNAGKSDKMRALNSRSMLLNAGVVGGARQPLLLMLRELVAVMRSLPTRYNCNMAALNYVLHIRFHSVLFTGYPLTSAFLAGETFTEDIFIKHK